MSAIRPKIKKKLKKSFKPRRPMNLISKEVRFIDYKDVELVSKFVNIHGRIHPSRITGLNASQQRVVAQAVKRARYMALIPYSREVIKK